MLLHPGEEGELEPAQGRSTRSPSSLVVASARNHCVTVNGSTTGSSSGTPPSDAKNGGGRASFPPPVQPATTLTLAKSLPLPVSNPNQLTRSQLLFQQAAGIDPRALRISSGEDGAFFLFMDMRLECQWVSYDMTPAKWVKATEEFNERLAELGKGKRPSSEQKHPRGWQRSRARLQTGSIAMTSGVRPFSV